MFEGVLNLKVKKILEKCRQVIEFPVSKRKGGKGTYRYFRSLADCNSAAHRRNSVPEEGHEANTLLLNGS